jgi:hypothetical protein
MVINAPKKYINLIVACCKGTPQFIHFIFPCTVAVHRVSLTFQGGFVPTRTAVLILSTGTSNDELQSRWTSAATLYPDDVNRKQVFDIEGECRSRELKLLMEETSDFFGRVTVYDVQLEGVRESEKDAG